VKGMEEAHDAAVETLQAAHEEEVIICDQL
jgi:hypothetical protein